MEGKKVLWVVFSIALALVVILAAGLFLLRPRQPKSPEAYGTAAPSLQGYDPYEYVRGTSVPPALSPPSTESQPTVIVVGEPPAGMQPVVPAIEPLAEPPAASAPQRAYPAAGTQAAEKALPAPLPSVKTTALPPSGSAPQARAPQGRAGGSSAIAQPAVPAKRAAARPKAVSVTEYWIQAGSFSSASRADEVTRRLGEQGLAARTTTRDLNGKTHFRVRIGPYTSRAEAQKFLDWIRDLKGFETSYISMVASRRVMP